MSQTQVQVQVEKEVADAVNAVVDLVAAIKAKKVDLGAELSFAVKLVNELPQIPAELKSDLAGSLNAAALGAVKLVQVLVSP